MTDSRIDGYWFYDKCTYKAIHEAKNQAREAGHIFVGPEFLLLGILKTYSESHSYICNLFSLGFDIVLPRVLSVVGIGFRSPRTTGKTFLTPKVKTIIAKAISKADSNMEEHVSCIYLLWALLEDNTNLACAVLNDLLPNMHMLIKTVNSQIDNLKVNDEILKQSNMLTKQREVTLENTLHRSPNLLTGHDETYLLNLKGKPPEEIDYIYEVLACLQINPADLKLIKKKKLRRYRIIMQFLTDTSSVSSLETFGNESLAVSEILDKGVHPKILNISNIQKYLQIFSHLWFDLQQHDKAVLFLEIPLRHLDSLKLCRQLSEWGNYEEERYIYETLLSVSDSSCFNHLQEAVFNLLLAKNLLHSGQVNKVYKKALQYCHTFSILYGKKAPHLTSDDESGRDNFLDIYDNTTGKAAFYHYYFMSCILWARHFASLGEFSSAIDEYEKCFWKIQSLEHDSVFRHFKYLTHASLELQMTALLECGNCYFKLRDYNSAIIRHEYAKQEFLDFMSDSNNDPFILSKENLSNYILNSLLLQIELGIARCYVAQKRYFDAHSIYYGQQLVLDTFFQQESLKGLALRLDYLMTVGKTYFAQKNYKDSMDIYMKALEVSKRISDSQSEAFICSQLANIFFSLKDYETANKYYTMFEQAFRIFQFLGHEAIIVYINWSKTHRKLKRYTKAASTRNKADFFRITLNRNLNQMRWIKRFKFERKKRDFEVRISNVVLRKTYGAWSRIEDYVYRACNSIRVNILDIVRLTAFLVLLPVVLLGLPVILLVSIYETVTEDKS